MLQICVRVWGGGKQPRHCKTPWDLPQMGKNWKRKGKSFWCAGEEDQPMCNAGVLTNKYCICLLPLTWHWKSLINLRNNDLCSKNVEPNHICLYHKFWIKCFRAFLKAVSLEYAGKRLLLMSSSVSERCGEGIVGCSCKVLSCTLKILDAQQKQLPGTSKDTEENTFILAESVLGLVMTTGGQTLDFVPLLKDGHLQQRGTPRCDTSSAASEREANLPLSHQTLLPTLVRLFLRGLFFENKKIVSLVMQCQ